MDAVTFVSNLIHDMAWPATVVAGLIIVIRNLSSLARFVKSVKYKDLEVTLHAEFEQVRPAIEEMQAKLVSHHVDMPVLVEDKTMQLAKIDPASALISVWQQLERKLDELMSHHGANHTDVGRRASFVQWLAKDGLIEKREAELYKRLRQIRNYAVHGGTALVPSQPTIAEVVEFKQFVEVFVKRLDELKDNKVLLNPLGKT